jgi:hypothetical protein
MSQKLNTVFNEIVNTIQIVLSARKTLIFSSLTIIIVYTVYIVQLMKKTKCSVERQKVRFYHTVIWGNAGTDGTLLFAGKTFGAFLILFTITIVAKNFITLILTNKV